MIEVEQQFVADCVSGILAHPECDVAHIIQRTSEGLMIAMARYAPDRPIDEIMSYGSRFRIAVHIRLGEIVSKYHGEHGHA